MIGDRSQEFDSISPNYSGPLYLEILPRTFPIVVRVGSRLSQIRFVKERKFCSQEELSALHELSPLVQDGLRDFSGKGVALSVDLKGNEIGKKSIIGYRAKRHTAAIDVDSENKYDESDFWDPLFSWDAPEGQFILDPNEFYIFASREFIQIPPSLVAEMIPYDHSIGEFRVHYAGFFDPGFGCVLPQEVGAKAVLEVRSSVPFVLEHGQIIGRLKYESMDGEPERLKRISLSISSIKIIKTFSPDSVEFSR